MSSFGKNIIPRRAHKERSQPASRVAKHGLLEKKKDYKQRAKDRNRKKLRVKLLKEKAAFRNPDEFYYGMIRSVTDSGRVRRVRNDAENNAVPLAQRDKDQRLLAETQDVGYVGMKYGLENGRLRKMEKGLHFIGAAAAAKRQHIVFVDDEEELGEYGAKHGESSARRPAPSAEHDIDKDISSSLGRRTNKILKKENTRAYKELEQRVERHEKLKTVLQDLGTEKSLLAKGRRFLIRKADPETGAPAVYRWQQERKR